MTDTLAELPLTPENPNVISCIEGAWGCGIEGAWGCGIEGAWGCSLECMGAVASFPYVSPFPRKGLAQVHPFLCSHRASDVVLKSQLKQG